MNVSFKNFEDYIKFAYSYIGKTVDDYDGVVRAITLYGEDHDYKDRISFCFKEKDGTWSECSVSEVLELIFDDYVGYVD